MTEHRRHRRTRRQIANVYEVYPVGLLDFVKVAGNYERKRQKSLLF